jgi:hypothetical protein
MTGFALLRLALLFLLCLVRGDDFNLYHDTQQIRSLFEELSSRNAFQLEPLLRKLVSSLMQFSPI